MPKTVLLPFGRHNNRGARPGTELHVEGSCEFETATPLRQAKFDGDDYGVLAVVGLVIEMVDRGDGVDLESLKIGRSPDLLPSFRPLQHYLCSMENASMFRPPLLARPICIDPNRAFLALRSPGTAVVRAALITEVLR